MATAVLDQTVSDTLIEQLGGGAPMQYFPHRGAPLLMERAVLVAQLHHGQPEGGGEVLSYTGHFVTKVNRSAIQEQGSHELQLMDVRFEERMRIVTT